MQTKTTQKLLSDDDALRIMTHLVNKRHGKGLETLAYFNDMWDQGCYQDHIRELVRAERGYTHSLKTTPQLRLPDEIVQDILAIMPYIAGCMAPPLEQYERVKHYCINDAYQVHVCEVRDAFWKAANPHIDGIKNG